MLLGLLMLALPPLAFLISLPFAVKLSGKLKMFYLLAGALVSIPGSLISVYLAAYTGDQGGIGAFFFQIFVIASYLLISLFTLLLYAYQVKNLKKE